MADKKETPAKKAAAPKRKTLTAKERIAKLEAELEAARTKAVERSKVAFGKIDDEIAKLETRKAGIEAKIVALRVKKSDLLPDSGDEDNGDS